jgi:serine/threonine protein kinase
VEELTTVTKSGAVIGTVAYMSPEQLRGKAVDHRSDIFSVGAILYEMLTGRRAFRGETEVDTITAVLREDPPEISLEQAHSPYHSSKSSVIAWRRSRKSAFNRLAIWHSHWKLFQMLRRADNRF